jgi:Domain of unknown function (DUF4340)
MKGKQLTLVLVLLVLLGGIALFLNHRKSATWSDSATTTTGGKVLDFPLNDVTQVTIKEAGTELNLIKKDDIWKVKERADYPADFDKVSALIRKLWELKPVQDVKIGPSQLARLQLTEPAQGANNGTLLDLKGAGDKRIAALLLGKKQMRDQGQPAAEGGGFAVGRYVMGQDGSNRVYLVSDTFEEIQMKPEQWLSRDFIKVDNAKSIAVAGTSPAMHWKLIRDAAASPWKLADARPGEEVDNAKASGVASIFSYGSFADVLAPDAAATETGLDKPATVHIETFDNFVYELKIGKLMGENYPVLVSVTGKPPTERTPAADEKPEDKARLDQEFQTRQKQLADKLANEQKLQARPYLVVKSTIDQMLKDRASLVAEKKPSPSPNAATSPAAAVSPPAKFAPPMRPPMKPPRIHVQPVPSPATASPSPANSPK